MVVVYQNLAMQYCCSSEKWSNKHTRRTSSICRNKNNFMGYSCWCWELSQKNVWFVFACCITYFHTANCRYEEVDRRLLQSFHFSDEEPRSTNYWSTYVLFLRYFKDYWPSPGVSYLLSHNLQSCMHCHNDQDKHMWLSNWIIISHTDNNDCKGTGCCYQTP